MPADSIAESLAQRVTFVFTGTVRALNAATMPDLTVNSRTAIVLVDEVLQAPAAFSNFAGQEITVQVGGRKKIAVGDKVTLFANSWRFGEGVAVQAIDFLPEEKQPARRSMTLAATPPHGLTPPRSSPAEALSRRKLQQHVDAADVVVTGRVKAVRDLDEAPPGAKRRGVGLTATAAAAAAVPGPRRRISEHDPLWQEAVVEVTGTEKGGTAKQIVVRFPSSRDVRWYKAPKFEPGQEGVFILRKPKSVAVRSTRALAAASSSGGAEVFSAEQPADFQPMHLAESIRTLIRPSEKLEAKPAAVKGAKTRTRRR
jgi:hypothetical protein